MRGIVQVLTTVVCLTPSLAWAQAVVAGRVTDAKGVSLAGVRVEASSPVLIEKSRRSTSDASGRYRIEGLRPGVYTITFVLAGYRTLQLDATELSGTRTLVLEPQLLVGPSPDYGYTPSVIDARSATRQIAIDDSTITSIPNTRNYNSLLVVVPGVTTDREDVVVDPLMTSFPFHGGRLYEGRLFVDGMSVGSAPHGGQPAHYIADVGNAEEVVFTTSGGLGEVETGGVVMNIVPKQGGNRTRASVFFSGTNDSMQGDNYSEELRAQGVSQGPIVTHAWDLDAALGGSITRDRLWYFVSGRRQSLRRTIPGLYFNQNAGNPASLLYVPDFTRAANSDRTWDNAGVRLTARATEGSIFSVFHDEQAICRTCDGATSSTGLPDALVSPEAQGVGDFQPQRFTQASWTVPATTRLFVDADLARSAYGWGNSERDGNNRGLVRVIGTPQFGGSAIAFRSQDWNDNRTATTTWRASMSWWTGAHTIKIGYQGLFASDDRTFQSNDQNVTYRASNGVANQITQVISPFTTHARVAQSSAYLQDQWTAGRLTIQAALRYDRVRSWFPEQHIGPSRFLPSPIVFPKTDGVDAYQDVTPRAGVAYDLSGDASTVVKISGGKYLEGASTNGIYGDLNPANRVVRSVNRGWTDSNLNQVPNCVLESSAGNGECGTITSTIPLGGLLTNSFDAYLTDGSNVRPSDWSIGASVEREVLPGSVLEVGYHRRWFDGFTVADNVLVSSADFQQVSATAPQNDNLPGGGGYTIGPLYLQNAASFGRFLQVTTSTDAYGNQSQRSDSLDVFFNARMPLGLTLQGGSSTRWTFSNSCEIRSAVPESAPLNPYCDVASGALTQFRGLAAYTIRRADVLIGAVYQNKPGPAIVANGSVFAGFSTFSPFITVNLIEPGTLYGKRISQLDLRAAKILRFGQSRAAVGIDLYNAFNSSSALTYSTGYLSFSDLPVLPTSVMAPRVLRIIVDVNF